MEDKASGRQAPLRKTAQSKLCHYAENLLEQPEPHRLRWQQAVRNNSRRIIFDCLAGENGSNKNGRETLFATTADTLEAPEVAV